MSLRCTIDSLMGRQHIECQDLPELLGAQEAIMAAFEENAHDLSRVGGN